jgi:lysozyme
MKLGNLKNKWLVGSISATLIAGATLWEGTRYTPYDDIVGVLTVCQGYTGSDIVRTKTYTPVECKTYLKRELAEHAEHVLRCTKVPLSQNQYDAFTLFTYNVGGAAYCNSSLLKKLNAGDYVGACNGLMAWTYAGGKHVPGLANRRKFERDLCLRGAT